MEFKKQTLLDETEKYIGLGNASKLTNESKIALTINQMAEIFERIHIMSVVEKLHESAALPLHDVTVSLPELKKKLLSMRFTKKQMKECDQQGTFIAYGWTDCLNKLLEWVHKKGNAR